MSKKVIKKCQKILAPLILVVILAFPFFHDIESNPFHGDENLWLHHGAKYFSLFFIEKDFDNPDWFSCWGFDQPNIGRLLMGFSLWLGGGVERLDHYITMNMWDFEGNYNPPMEIDKLGRYFMALFGLLSCLVTYFIGCLIAGQSVGFISAILLGFSPLVLVCSRRTMSDAPLLFFMTLTVLLTMLLFHSLKHTQTKRSFVFALLIGLSVGMAAGVKLNGALSGIFFAVALIYYAIVRLSFGKGTRKESSGHTPLGHVPFLRLLSLGSTAALTSFILFYSFTPTLYRSPISSAITMVVYRLHSVEIQQTRGAALYNFEEKIDSAYDHIFRPGKKNSMLFTSNTNVPIDLMFFIIGLIVLFKKEISLLKRERYPTSIGVVLIWCIVTYVGIVTWIPLRWERYYMPLIPCTVLVSAVGIHAVCSYLYKLRKLSSE